MTAKKEEGHSDQAIGIVLSWKSSGEDCIPVLLTHLLRNILTQLPTPAREITTLFGFSFPASWVSVTGKMPLDIRTALQVGLLLSALPAQYMITVYMSSSQISRQYALQGLISSALTIRDKYFSWDYWHHLCTSLIMAKPLPDVDEDDEDESPAFEVLKYRGGDQHFTNSLDIRSPRPASVLYRVGQVMEHKLEGYRGVIVGWDDVVKAPEKWLSDHYPKDKPQWQQLPHYSVLVDTQYTSSLQKTYVPQENIEIVTNVKVTHPNLEEYFEGYDGAQYLPRSWLRYIYPND
ncbi:hypothetical protein LSH36_782g05010 [Paralvinella palmiformis]|uniref:Hemimethylated DNA-binding domain-containing protein n=1 Tax=Paralvinella palmiformis TaxID=53620 RepID=A0AAD9J0M3_9ANNE|nr:hypothetical protein LSH36_782g05010 [Paralvinella palmiformis]